MFSIQTNYAALYTGRMMTSTQHRLESAAARVSSGLRINSARDDAAGLAISSRMMAQSRGTAMRLRNLNDQVSLLQVADSALASISDNLQRIRELAIQSANGTQSLSDRQAMQDEATQLITASRQIQNTTSFNNQALLDGHFQIEDNAAISGQLPLSIAPVFQPRITDVLLRYAQMSQASATFTPAGALSVGDLSINQHAIPASVTGSQTGQDASSAWAIANAINQAGSKDLTVAINAASITGIAVVQPNGGHVAAGDIVINGIAVKAGTILGAINGISGQTGVTAQMLAAPPQGGQAAFSLVLSASDGRNIDIAGAGAFGVGDSHAVGSITLTGPLAEGDAASLSIGGANPGNAGLASGKIAAHEVGGLVPIPLTEEEGYDLNPDLMSVDAAQATIGLMDSKLDKLLTQRTRMGAMLNTLDFAGSKLASSNEALQASISRIRDTDYAQETLSLTRERILLEAGMAMSVQANAESRRVLMLLAKG